jgi:hypothetical protein
MDVGGRITSGTVIETTINSLTVQVKITIQNFHFARGYLKMIIPLL